MVGGCEFGLGLIFYLLSRTDLLPTIFGIGARVCFESLEPWLCRGASKGDSPLYFFARALAGSCAIYYCAVLYSTTQYSILQS